MKEAHLSGIDCRYSGFTLTELVLAMGLGTVLLLGLVQMVSAIGSTTRLQDNQAQLQDRARYAAEFLSQTIRQAGFSPQPWEEHRAITNPIEGSGNHVSSESDRLVIRSWSDRNCFDHRNPDTDAESTPLYYYRESTFELNGSGYLSLQCRYGRSESELVRQISRQGVIKGCESFQLLFAEDANSNGIVERWVNESDGSDATRVAGVRVGIILASDDPVIAPEEQNLKVLDQAFKTPRDGRLRRVFEFDVALRGRAG